MISIALIHPDIPQNTGNIGRLCVGLNAKLHLVRPMGFVLDDKRIRRAGLDYWQHLDLVLHANVEEFLHAMMGRQLYFFTTKATKLYTDVDYRDGDILVYGAESKGLPPELRARFPADCVKIPMFGPIRSLNIATAVGIGAYEAVRRISRSSADQRPLEGSANSIHAHTG